MAKKRTGKSRAMRADFWTALPIDECRARVMELQHNSAASRSHQSLTTINSRYNTFRISRDRQLTPWQSGHWSPGGERATVQFALDGSLRATADGTRVSLEITSDTRLLLWIETARAGCGIPFAAMWAAMFARVTLEHFFSRDNPIFEELNGEGFGEMVVFTFFLGLSFILTAAAVSFFSFYRVISTTPKTLVASVHNELYVPSSQSDPDMIDKPT